MKIEKSLLIVVAFAFSLLIDLAGLPALTGAATCESIATLKLPNTTITSAEFVTGGTFTPPGLTFEPEKPPSPHPPILDLPAFCRVTGSVKPTAESDVKFEVWMPIKGWNGRFQGVANGNFCGSIQYDTLAAGLRRGNATSSTNAGHDGCSPTWAKDHPQLVLDFAKAFHYLAEESKPVINAFYGAYPKHSYFTGCSAGGKQTLWEAQRYPADYDGYLVGCPVLNETHAQMGVVWNSQALLNDPASTIPTAKLQVIANAVLARCDALDGLEDGLVTDPRRCDFDPSTLLCKGPDAPTCLTEPQVKALKKFYAGPVNSCTGGQIFPGMPPGVDPVGSLYYRLAHDFWRGMVFEDLNYNALTSLNFCSDVAFADNKLAGIINATNHNLRPLKTLGGKIIHWHSWQDQNLNPLMSIDYYKDVVATMGSLDNVQDFYRLFMTPGTRHCRGGSGPNSFNGGSGQAPVPTDAAHDMLTALEEWVEHDIAPDKIIATKYVNDKPELGVQRTRPLCPYPQVAVYIGTGSIDDASNFVCQLKGLDPR